jgi:hypothetical protein
MDCPERSEVHGVEHSSTASESGLVIGETSSVKLVLFAIVPGSEALSGKVGHPIVNIE